MKYAAYCRLVRARNTALAELLATFGPDETECQPKAPEPVERWHEMGESGQRSEAAWFRRQLKSWAERVERRRANDRALAELKASRPVETESERERKLCAAGLPYSPPRYW